MISNQTIKATIDGIKKISKVDIFVFDKEGNFLVGTAFTDDNISDVVLNFAKNKKTTETKKDVSLFTLVYENMENQILAAKGDNAKVVGEMAAFQITSLEKASQSQTEEGDFIKKLISNDFLPADLHNQTKQLDISVKGERCAFVIEAEHEKNGIVIEAIKNAITGDSDLISDIDNNTIVLIKELSDKKDFNEISQIANTIVDMLNTEIMLKTRVGYGNIVKDIKDVAISYNEAKTALEVGDIFKTEQQVVSFNELGVAKLIYQMPLSVCEEFIDEIFGDIDEGLLDEDTAVTVEKMLENNLNVSEASRQLFIHRNTLIYRLDKIQKVTGFDIRIFEDAMTFKTAMMVKKYLEYMNDK